MSSEIKSRRAGIWSKADLFIALYKRAVLDSPDLISIVDRDRVYRAVNRAYLKRYARTEQEMVGRSISDVLGADVYEKAVKPYLDRCFAGEEVNYQEWFSYGDIGRRYMDVSYYPLPNDDGVIEYVAAVIRDINDNKRAEEALRESEERYRSLIEQANDAIIAVDLATGKVTGSNSFTEKALRYTKQQILDLPSWLDLIHPDDRPAITNALGRYIADGTRHPNFPFRALRSDGTFLHVEQNAALIFDSEGNPRSIVAIARDVTDRRRMEEALQESEEKVRALLNSCIDIAMLVDRNGLILTLNETAAARFGKSVEDLLGANVNSILPPDVAERRWGKVEEVFKTKRAVRAEDERDGLIFDTNYYPILGRDGEVVRLAVYARDITEEKRTKQELQRSTERYRDIFWEAPDLFFMMDVDTWIITDANKHALEALEYGPEKIGNIHVSEIVHPEDFERAAKRLRDMLINEDRMPRFPLRIVSRTGKVLHIEQSGVVFKDETGRPKSFLGLAHDVTEVRTQEELVRRRNERLSALYEVAASANESLDLKTRIDAILEVVCRITNADTMSIFSFDEGTQRFRYLAHRGVPEEVVRATDNMPTDQGIHKLLFRDRIPLLIPDINVHPFLSRPLPVEQIDIESAIAVPLVVKGKLLGSMWVARKPNCPFDEEDLELVTAIGNRVATALENAGLYSRVAEREAHLNSILETSRDGIAVLNQNQRIVFRNSAMSSIFGYDDSDDLAALDTQEFFTPESWSILEDIRRRLAEGCLIDEIIKFKAKRKDGTIFDAEARLGNFMENGERFDVAVLRDMTERNRMDFQLQQSNKLAAIGELAAGVAHEINNPVATVQVQTGLMRDIIGDEQAKIEKPLLSRIEEILDTIEDQVERCQSVTNGLLSFSRTPEGKEGICDINNLVEWTVRFVSDLMDRKATITKNLDGRNPVCPGDPHRLEQVFVNLMTNAWKAAGPKGAVAITTRLDPAGTISIEFADSGPGIPKNVLGRIFEPFFTTNPEGEGTGLGLSISHYIIQGMNGKIDVESTPGEGSRFTVVLQGAGTAEGRLANGS